MTEEINQPRRRFIGAAALTVAAAQLGMMGAARAQSESQAGSRMPAITPGTNTSFAALRQIDAGVLNIGYAEVGASDAPPVILLHGWPYDIHTYVDVAPLLAVAGYRVIVPYLRGYGTTRFLSDDTPRNGQQSAIATDIIALMDALKIEKAIIAGCDWGARTANIIAALWPERLKAMVSVSGYLIGSREVNSFISSVERKDTMTEIDKVLYTGKTHTTGGRDGASPRSSPRSSEPASGHCDRRIEEPRRARITLPNLRRKS